MTNKLIKVDRVHSVSEAVALEGAGADMIGVALSPDPRFADDRVVTVEEAAAIGKSLARATLVTTMELTDRDRVLRTAAAIRTSVVQPITSAVPPQEVRTALSDAGVGVAYSGLEINHDDDPSWVFSAYKETPDLNAVLFQADVLPEYRGSWKFLRDESPEYEDEFQISDLNDLAREWPLVVNLDFTPDNIKEVLAALPDVRGIAFTLAGRARRGDVHFHQYADVLRVLGAVGG
jgi:phosphoribosylanthranilate isomerase